jgi:carboxypeptidase C (cathepsin A)
MQVFSVRSRLVIWLVAGAFLAGNLQAAEGEKKAEDKAAETQSPAPRSFVTEHSERFNGVAMRYRVTAGETYLRDKDGKPKASIFTFAYIRTDSKGPRPVSVPSDARHPGAPPYPVSDAPETILDVTDLVFVDPVGTGFSRALGAHKGKEFWGLREDAQSMAEFIRTWVTDNGRWNALRFLLGESFGTTRAALVARLLESDDFMMSLNGLIFISQALDYTGSTPTIRDNIIAHATCLPTMAAAVWYHG